MTSTTDRTMLDSFADQLRESAILANCDTVSHRFTPVLGQDVGVCYDGKWSRAVPGIITEVRRRSFVVLFVPWPNTESGLAVPITFHRRKGRRRPYGAWLIGEGEGGILRMLGCRGDWYTVFPAKLLKLQGYLKQAD